MNVKISELKSRIGTVIPGISGVVKKVFPPKEGDGAHGKWKLQNITLEDASGLTQVTLSGLETMDESSIGDAVQFQSNGTKFGLKGVSVEERSYKDKSGNDKTVIGVKVTKTAELKWEGKEGVQEDVKDDLDMSPSNADKGLDEKVKEYFDSKPKARTPKERIAQFGKLYDICVLQALKVDDDWKVDLIKDIATTFFIQAVREGLADKMEVKDEDEF